MLDTSYKLPSDFKPITLQNILDAARQAFIIENKPPALMRVYGKDPMICAYLTPNGRKCGIGLVIPDGHPAQEVDDLFGELIKLYPELWAADVIAAYEYDPELWEADVIAAHEYAFAPEQEGGFSNRANQFQSLIHDNLADTDRGCWNRSIEQRDLVYAEVAREFGLNYRRVFP